MSTIENEIQEKGLTAPRIKPQDVEDNIVAAYYTTGDKMTEGCPQHPSLGLLTVCVLVLKNGFTVIGKSACVSPENFDAEIGQKVARADAVNQIWPLMGYELATLRSQQKV